MDVAHQIQLFGADQNLQPPDTQIAAGPANVAEADNSVLSVWAKTGALLQSTDLNVMFAVPTGYQVSDPRILYDAESSRWFLSTLSFNTSSNSAGFVYLAVSTTSDPTGAWSTYQLFSSTTVLPDQPKVGVNTDKVVISWNDFQGTTFTGEQTIVAQKSDALAAAPLRNVLTQVDASRAEIVPAQSLSATTTEWLSYNNSDCAFACNSPGHPSVGVVAITGTPATNDVKWTESDVPMTPTAVPPPPRQPSGTAVTPDNDDRFLSAVWLNGALWQSATDACVPAGDSTTRDCMRLVEVSTAGAPSIAQDFDAASLGIDVYYPALTLNSLGDLFIGFSQSSPNLFPSAAAVDSLATSPATLENTINIAAGQTSYSGGSVNRWGDYSGAAQDPSNPNDVWLAAEFQASATSAGDWGTAAIRSAIQPTIATVSPSAGPLSGGQSVTVTGSHFQPGASVSFASAPATNVAVVSSTQITATTPAASSAGTVAVAITEPDGTSATNPAAYTYVSAPAVTGVVPASGTQCGGTSVTITGSNFINVTAVDVGAKATSFQVNSATQITATTPSSVAGTVDVTVVAAGGTSAVGPSDQFTYVSGAPGPPTNVSAAAGDGEATVAWTPPPSDSQCPITGYRITPYANGAAQPPTTTPVVTSYLVTGLTDGTSYTFTVAAINNVGTGPDSVPSAAVTPQTPTLMSLGGVMSSGPGAASWSAQRLDVFVRGSDNALWHRSWDGTSWTDWESLGGVLKSDPAAISITNGRIDVFVKGADNALWYRTYDSTSATWTPWTSLGGVLIGGPEVSSWSSTHMDVFVRGSDRALWHKSWDGGTWSDWSTLGGILSSDPSAVSAAPNTIDVFVRGADRAMWWNHFDGSGWSGWSSRGGILSSGPDAASCGSGRLDVFVVGGDSAIWRQQYDGSSWNAWQSLGGIATADTSSVCRPGTNVVDTFLRGGDDALWFIATNGP